MKNSKQTPQGTSPVKAPVKRFWPQARATEVAPNCPRVGDEGKVAYPPFLMAYDRNQEGENTVARRVTAPQPKEKNRR